MYSQGERSMLVLCLTFSDDEFCNAIINGELTSDGQPLHMHTAFANETDPAISPVGLNS